MKKKCPNCQTPNGVRALNCKSCGKGFIIKKVKQPDLVSPKASTAKSKITQLINRKLLKDVPEDWRNLKRGDIFRVVSGGGQWKNNNKEIISFGYKGIFKVHIIETNGIVAYPLKTKGICGSCFIYCGKERVLESGTILYPHKIVKVQQKVKN